MDASDAKYLKVVIDPILRCKHYKPKFGQGVAGAGLTLEQFRILYQADAFYSWFGLDNSLLYAAHKAAGGMTSVYRQIGIGCEKLFRQILMDSLDLSAHDVVWSYQRLKQDGTTQTLTLDGRVPLDKISPIRRRGRGSEGGCRRRPSESASRRRCLTR